MYPSFTPAAKRVLLPTLLLLGLVVALFLAACAPASTPTAPGPTPTPAGSSTDLASEREPTMTPHPSPPPPQEQTKGESGGVAGSPVVVDSTRYQWVGQIVVSELRGIELARSCDTWALTFGSPEVENKAVNSAGLKMIVWGTLSPVDSRSLIHVEAVYSPGGPMPEVVVPDYPCPGEVREQLYSWVGVVEVNDLEGRHLELDRGCDTWVLLAESEEVARKLEAFKGKKIMVWGVVFTGPSIYMRPTISVRSAHGPDDPVIALYVPEYPCPGVVVPPEPPVTRPAEFDLLPGEIAAVGRVVREGQGMYLETPSGRIALKDDASGQMAVSGGPAGETTSGAGPASVPPSYAEREDVLVAGKWLVEGGQLAIVVRYTRTWGYYRYPLPVPPPLPRPQPTTEPQGEMGVLYGQVRIGPLCPVEPCPAPTPDVYSSRALVLESETGERLEVPLTPDGWFKVQVKAGVYVVTLTDCNFLGCRTALPRKVQVAANEVTTLEIDIDTGIR